MTQTEPRADHGTWPSRLDAPTVARAGVRHGQIRADGSSFFWSEARPAENGRVVIVQRSQNGAVTDILPAPYSARSRVHEYGGGEFAVFAGQVAFINDTDQDLYLLQNGGQVERLTSAPVTRFADMTFDPVRRRLLAVAERHDPGQPVANLLVSVDLTAANAVPHAFAGGRDFYASPSFSPDGRRVAWLTWDLPHMPWEAAELWVGEINADGALAGSALVAEGGAFQPEWAPDGSLYFIAGHQGWGNLHRWRNGQVKRITESAAEFGRPQWVFGMRSFAVLSNTAIFAAPMRDGVLEPCVVELSTGKTTGFGIDARRLDNCAAGTAGLAVITASDTQSPCVGFFGADANVLAGPQKPAQVISGADISIARVLTIPVDQGSIFALYYPPANAARQAPKGALAPLMVNAHGGPTGMAKRGLDLKVQYWTQRGFAVLDVDYRGSFGYGKAYMEALNGQWGALDVDDIVTAAKYAARAGLADAARMVISGSSAGGLTVLNALAGARVFAAGASYYGVADLAALASDTHKFESGYLTALVGGDVAGAPDIYQARSPINRAGEITVPVILFQGLDDKVVPPAQSRAMAASLRARAIPVEMLEYAGEAHGFRQAETVISALQAEYDFFSRVLFGEN